MGFNSCIIDANAENLSEDEISDKVKNISPSLICLVVYGQNVNAGTTNMSGAVSLSTFLKKKNIKVKGGSTICNISGVFIRRNVIEISNHYRWAKKH